MKTLILFLFIIFTSCISNKHYIYKKQPQSKPKYSIAFTKIDTTYWNGTDSITFTKELIINYTLDLRK